MEIHERLKELRVAKGLTQVQVALMLDMHPIAYQRYEIGTRLPPLDKVKALADFYDVSIDYLVGRTENRQRL